MPSNMFREDCRPAVLRMPVSAWRSVNRTHFGVSRLDCSPGEIAARCVGALNRWLTFSLPAAYSSCSRGFRGAPQEGMATLRYLFEDYSNCRGYVESCDADDFGT